MKTIGIVTVSRSDYGIYEPLLLRLRENADLKLNLIVSGTHLSPGFGNTVEEIERAGFPISGRVEMLLDSDTPVSAAKSAGLGIIGFADVFSRTRPDILVLLGDRLEMHAAGVAAVPFNIPVAHIHGGETTIGAIDELFRHSLTKLSHIHFAANKEYADKIIQMGEEPWRVIVTGAPGLDGIRERACLSKDYLEKHYQISLSKPALLVTFHPVTTELESTGEYITSLITSLSEYEHMNIIFTYPGADSGNNTIINTIKYFAENNSNVFIVRNFGHKAYTSIMNYVSAMIGNSSSGIIEAPSFRLPVVNIGSRQEGRIRAKNVIDTGYSAEEISRGIATALSGGFLESLEDMENPYGDGKASSRILSFLEQVDFSILSPKRFHDLKHCEHAVPVSQRDQAPQS